MRSLQEKVISRIVDDTTRRLQAMTPSPKVCAYEGVQQAYTHTKGRVLIQESSSLKTLSWLYYIFEPTINGTTLEVYDAAGVKDFSATATIMNLDSYIEQVVVVLTAACLAAIPAEGSL